MKCLPLFVLFLWPLFSFSQNDSIRYIWPDTVLQKDFELVKKGKIGFPWIYSKVAIDPRFNTFAIAESIIKREWPYCYQPNNIAIHHCNVIYHCETQMEKDSLPVLWLSYSHNTILNISVYAYKDKYTHKDLSAMISEMINKIGWNDGRTKMQSYDMEEDEGSTTFSVSAKPRQFIYVKNTLLEEYYKKN
ncbi:MAG: hypothetical protein M0D57_06000 [Sphingobacteriales bacterium JAD_PAG50586_3]|nr:MAG: hypothetical protein M0D57_06000 [Sphingobacteriales bacterium JAD_PAG50586_3]